MTGALEWLGLAILLGWVAQALIGFWAGPDVALGLGLACGTLTLFARRTRPLAGLMALMSPVGVMLPALALRQVAAAWGVPVEAFGTWELVVFLLAYLGFLVSAMGVVPVDVYRLGYAPVPVAMMVLAVCAYGLWSGTLFLPLVAVVGQAFWAAGRGSSNWFDYVLHAGLVAVAGVVLVLRVL
ncbi:hypothetical protein RA2_03340 [Roseovarius sp. A-2]|uniref:hypothetical protein n=1 Tax=Roseovarius sp. A-2 TaxID=1570360 RepID=UPI0009C835B6|nr:hypothetical protein [Roseovarius sp. A-2]GAW36270.1 hypothetical protein RA2_03340 [Roseovarius sp. A-2]